LVAVVATKYLLVEVALKMERLNTNVGSAKVALE